MRHRTQSQMKEQDNHGHTKSELQHNGCTRRQAVELHKAMSAGKGYDEAMSFVKSQFPEGGKAKK